MDIKVDQRIINDAEELSVSNLYNASQIRIDTWNRLKGVIARLQHTQESGGDITQYRDQVAQLLNMITPIEMFWGFPGRTAFQQLQELLWMGDYKRLNMVVRRIVRALMSNAYRHHHIDLAIQSFDKKSHHDVTGKENEHPDDRKRNRPYFEVLVVDNISPNQEENERLNFHEIRRFNDSFVYEPVFVHTFEDALLAVLLNHNLQSVVIRYDFPLHSEYGLNLLKHNMAQLSGLNFNELESEDYSPLLAELIKKLRPELDIFLVTDQSVEDIASKVSSCCRRVFYNQEDYLELHLNILRALQARYKSPFFSALKEYSKQPMGVFHAMPISRGKSITKSNWIKDMGDFYGMNTFLAETSATSGGLDSLLEPTGPLKEAQELASRAFGSRKTFFATNGTSTCNKIVVQALTRPGDIVLVDRDCHKSHHYGMMLAGAEVIYLDSYPLHEYSMYGAVRLEEIKHTLMQLKRDGKLARTRMLLLTNCTFDGIVYNVERFMQECLAIKPDLIFLWDEAWFGFARFAPTYRLRTAMFCAQQLRDRYRSPEYREQYQQFVADTADIDPLDLDTWSKTAMLPDPDKVRVRVYATQSTHKTLTSLRQGSMIHIYDQDYNSKAEESFHEAYMTHTSTSPNYQILASLDIGRRQVELEGFELVQKQVEMAMVLRRQIRENPQLNKFFKVLSVDDMIPIEHRQSQRSYYESDTSWTEIWGAWANDEFVLDATRITLCVSNVGVDGDTFKNDYLMDKYGIQVNKTSRNTVLFMTNIGTTRSSVAYLLEVLVQISEELERTLENSSRGERLIYDKKVYSLTEDLPPLPDFSYFHHAFQPDPGCSTGEGLIRAAFFLSYDDECCEYLNLETEIPSLLNSGRELVSASFITPYPPGFPILVPGQVISQDILTFLTKLDVKEIHGFRSELGLRVFTEPTLENYKLITG